MLSSAFTRLALILVGSAMNDHLTNAFSSSRNTRFIAERSTRLSSMSNSDNEERLSNRRTFLCKTLLSGVVSAGLAGGPIAIYPAAAEDEDTSMTSKLFNSDGSLKGSSAEEGVVDKDLEAKSRKISLLFPSTSTSSSSIVSVDGAQVGGETGSDSSMKVTYQTPEKWTQAPEYLDTLSNNQKSCERVIIHQAPGLYKDEKILEKASLLGIAKSLGITTTVESGVYPSTLSTADVISGRKVKKPSSSVEEEGESTPMRTYYEFDLAVAPNSCGKSAENLGLGFCPYDTIVLLSAAIVNQKMMVIGITCKKDEWQRASADIKRVRESFYVDGALA